MSPPHRRGNSLVNVSLHRPCSFREQAHGVGELDSPPAPGLDAFEIQSKIAEGNNVAAGDGEIAWERLHFFGFFDEVANAQQALAGTEGCGAGSPAKIP